MNGELFCDHSPAREDTPVICPECASENPAEDTYCVVCGAALAGDTTTLVPLALGTVLAERYVIESVHSYGSENRYVGRRCDGTSGRVLVREREREEAALWRALVTRAASLAHPAIVVPEDYFELAERGYLVCPEVPGIRLTERIGRTTEREAVAWGVQLCQLLGFLHRHELLCLEFPPEWLVLSREGRLCLTHLDVLTGKSSAPEERILTDGYAAPETYKATAVDERSEVFAVAALLYTLLVGKRLPVEGWAVQPELPVFYPDKVLSPRLERVLRKALAYDPQERYESVEVLKKTLLAVNQHVRVRSAWLSDVGEKRDHNEDAVLLKESVRSTVAGAEFVGLYIVSDGMGGAAAGEVASALAVQTIAEHVEQRFPHGYGMSDGEREACLREAIVAANAAIYEYGKEHRESAGLGATVVAALICGSRCSLAWVGDSRAYLWERGHLQQLSRDHSLVARLVEIGQISPAEARTHEHRHLLIRSLGSKEHVVVDSLSHPLARGTKLLLCSDGLTTHVEDQVLSDILSRHRDPGDAALELVVAANAGGGSDNISVVVVFYE
ncbi:MAG: Stp1/IreP family PP2C-type Ser/Thr phosphatase [Candidatus Binatia bacterium]|nr:Stp1/IreP family PP2C-type Ser/Thr phosphatase [Candidatus Binatia bacterium]